MSALCPSVEADSRSSEAGSRRLARRPWVGLTLLAAGVGAGGAVASAAAASEPARGYIVEMAGAPAAGYRGGVPGYPATRPQPGARLDSRASEVARYRAHLRQRHDDVLTRGPRHITRTYDYTLVFNGFGARMAPGAAAQLARTPGVLSVSPDRTRRLQTISTPGVLGLTGSSGLWSTLGGVTKAGTGVVIGVLDSGITPESPSFAPLPSPGKLHAWQGVCQTGEQWTAANCSNKIIGARYYTAGAGGPDAIHQMLPSEIVSARDTTSHGTHVAGTAAGNNGVSVTAGGNFFGLASGMAPNARIAVYKSCWSGGCSDSDSVQAIEDATADGVDVINHSTAGSQQLANDPVSRAFLFAADAGVFVAAGAGNNGPTPTVQNVEPWVTTVAAGTHDRVAVKTVTLGNGAQYTGAGRNAASPSRPLIRARDAGLGADPDGARQCLSGSLDPAKVAGKIVICERGTNGRFDAAFAVTAAGAAGMILTNVQGGLSDAVAEMSFDSAFPLVHVTAADGAAIEAYAAADANPTAALSAGTETVGQEAPAVWHFSSRGPAHTIGGNLLKPDILAPGVRVIAPTVAGWGSFSGTSMATPHVAGLAALLIQSHPNWSAMAIKSALLTSASAQTNKGHPIITERGELAGPFDYGSGQATPAAANDPGLVYDSDLADWERWSCGVGVLAPDSPDCQLYGSADPADLNTPNIAIGSLVGEQTVTRKVTNVGPKPSTYTVQVAPPPGFDVVVNPTTLKLGGNGARAKYTVKFTRTTAPLDTYSSGSLTWSDGRHAVRSQLVVRPVGFLAPPQLMLSGPSGSTTIPVKVGYTGSLQTTVSGLAGDALSTTLTRPTANQFDPDQPATSEHTAKFTFHVPSDLPPPGALVARFETHDSDVPAGTDINLWLYNAGTTQRLRGSAGPTAEERLEVPCFGQEDGSCSRAGDYDVYVDLAALPDGLTTQDVVLHTWVLAGSEGNLTITPSTTSVQAGQTVNLTATWSGLSPGRHYIGDLSYSDGTSELGFTQIEADG